MFKSCSFGGSDRSGACIELIGNKGHKVFTPGMGLCYMFNFGSNHSQDLTMSYANANNGLRLDIDIEGIVYDSFMLTLQSCMPPCKYIRPMFWSKLKKNIFC